MKILITSPSLEPRLSGVSFRYRNLIEGLSKNNEIYVIGYDEDFHKFLPKTVKDYYYFPCMSVPTYEEQKIFNILLFYPYFFYSMFILIKNKIDIVHLAGPDSNFILWVELTNILGIHLIYSHHTDITSYLDTRPKLNNSIIKAIIKKYDQYIMEYSSVTWLMSSFFYKRLIDRHQYKIDKKKIDILKVGVDRRIFYPKYDANLLSLWEKDSLRILLVARISSEKYIEFVINVIRNIKNVSLLIIGKGPDDNKIKKLSNDINNINFIGFIEHDKLAPYYSQADLFIQPSNNETLGFTILESLACGTPVINCKDCSNFIKNDYNGYTYKFGDKEDLKKLLINLRTNFDKTKKQMTKNCLTFVKNYKWESVIEQLNKKYKEVMMIKKDKKMTLFLVIHILFIIYITKF